VIAARPEVLMAMTIHVMVFRKCHEYGGSMDIQNTGILPYHYTVSQPRRPQYKQ